MQTVISDDEGWQEVRFSDVPVPFKVRAHHENGRVVVTGLCIEEPDGLSPHTLRAVSIQRCEMLLNPDLVTKDFVALPPRKGRNHPDEFYKGVADLYRRALADGEAPGPAIASRGDVPITTAHRWIREARRRQLLPSGRRGRAG